MGDEKDRLIPTETVYGTVPTEGFRVLRIDEAAGRTLASKEREMLVRAVFQLQDRLLREQYWLETVGPEDALKRKARELEALEDGAVKLGILKPPRCR